jgi:hypothetical protein
LSPLRILLALMSIPVLATSLTVAIFIRTSPYDAPVALAHLIALGGCDAAASVGMAPAREGGPGYHPRNDPDGDGVACGTAAQQLSPQLQAQAGQAQAGQAQPGDATAPERMNAGAKFLRP